MVDQKLQLQVRLRTIYSNRFSSIYEFLERRETTKERERSEKKISRSEKKETPARESTREPTPREQTPREREKIKEPKKEEKREKDESEGSRKRDKEGRRGEKRSSPAAFYDQLTDRSYPIDVDMDNPREPRERSKVERERDLSSVSNSSNGSVNQRNQDQPPPENDRGKIFFEKLLRFSQILIRDLKLQIKNAVKWTVFRRLVFWCKFRPSTSCYHVDQTH